MSDEVRKRAACDRCHSQKIKCPRRPGQNTCDRCLRAKAICVFRPFRQKKSPEESRENENESVANGGFGLLGQCDEESMVIGVKRKRFTTDSQDLSATSAINLLEDPSPNFDADCMAQEFVLHGQDQNDMNLMSLDNQDPFMSFEFNNTGTASTEISSSSYLSSVKRTPGLLASSSCSSLFQSSDSSPLPYIWSIPSHSTAKDTKSSCIKTLSQLSIDLYEHSQTIPPLTIHDTSPAKTTDTSVTKPSLSDYSIDDVFGLTQAMIEVYPRFLIIFARQKDAMLVPLSNASMDHSFIFLILSCHLRLINIYEELFKHMHLCRTQYLKDETAQQDQPTTPQLKTGSQAPQLGTIPMQMFLLIQFATQLYQFVSTLAAEIREPGVATPSGSQGDLVNGLGGAAFVDATLVLTRAMAENVKDRAGSMSQQMDAMKTIMSVS